MSMDARKPRSGWVEPPLEHEPGSMAKAAARKTVQMPWKAAPGRANAGRSSEAMCQRRLNSLRAGIACIMRNESYAAVY